MPKYFVDISELNTGIVKPTREIAHHLVKVLRVKVGDRVVLGDGLGWDYHCRVESIDPLIVNVECRYYCDTELPCAVTLYQAVPKSHKFDLIIQKTTELGVRNIVPVYTERSVVKERGNEDKLLRLQKIAESAAGQSMRGFLPKISRFLTWKEAIFKKTVSKGNLVNEETHKKIVIVAHEKEMKSSIWSVMGRYKFNSLNDNDNADALSAIDLWIGPEGGFSVGEVEEMKECGFHFVSLGPRILRTETAAIAALAQIVMILDNCSGS